MDYRKLKKGDKVKLVSNRPSSWNSGGMMDHFLESIQIIKSVNASHVEFEDAETRDWGFMADDIAEICPTEPVINNNYSIY